MLTHAPPLSPSPVPVLGLLFLPTLLLSTLVFVYSVPTLAYLWIAQADPPPGEALPFLPPLSDLSRHLVITLTGVRWTWSLLSLLFPVGREWCLRRVQVVVSARTSSPIVSLRASYHSGQTLSVYSPAKADDDSGSPTFLRPIIVIVPSPTSILPSAVLSLLALRLRLSGYVVVLPSSAFPRYPQEGSSLPASSILLRHVLAWTARHARELGGDPTRIHLISHGAGALVAMMGGGVFPLLFLFGSRA